MSAAIIAQLLITFGPQAIQLIESLNAVWSKPSLTPDEVTALCVGFKTSYEQYRADAKAAAGVSQNG